jgi:gliding motility-associated-like protein
MTGRDSVWTTGGLVEGDTVFCILTNNNPCVLQPLDTSNRIVIGRRAPQSASVAVNATATTVCSGGMVHFAANGINGGDDPGYQWQLNGVDIGSDSSGFSHAGWRNGDVVTCVMTSADHCVASPFVVSTPVVLQVDSVAAAASIGASRTTVCSGDTVTFTAEATNGGVAPAFGWLVDGQAVPATGEVWSTNSLADGDVVQCIMTGSLTCSQPVLSGDSIVMTVRPTPRLRMNADTTIARGQAVRLDAVVTGVPGSYQWEPVVGLSGAQVADPVASPLVSTVYQLTVTAEDGCKTSGITTIDVYAQLRMPNAFTPDGDGRNDIFRIPPGLYITLLRFSVYDRWGQRVFFTISSGEGWDGRVHGLAQPPGVYVWEIEYVDSLLKRKVDKSGEVILLR